MVQSGERSPLVGSVQLPHQLLPNRKANHCLLLECSRQDHRATTNWCYTCCHPQNGRGNATKPKSLPLKHGLIGGLSPMASCRLQVGLGECSSKEMKITPIHFLSSSSPPTRQGSHQSCSAQLGDTKIFTGEHSPFIPAKFLLNWNKGCIYSHYSQYIYFQSGLLSAHPKQQASSFQKRQDFGPHHYQEMSHRTTGFN